MQHIENILCPLLLRNDCVIIPSLGGFVANYVSAKVDVNKGVIIPPSKALSFNKNLINNDGLIVNFLAKEENISYEEANAIITREIQQIKSELNQGKRIHFQNVGFLYLNEIGKIAFEQERFFNLLLSSYGLKNVHFVAEKTKEEPVTIATAPVEETIQINTIAAAEVKEPVKELVKETDVETPLIVHPAIEEQEKSSKKLVGKIIKYVAVAALVPLLFYSFWIPMKTDVLSSGILYSDDFNPFKTNNSEISYEPYLTKRDYELTITYPEESNNLSLIVDNISNDTKVFSYPLQDDFYVTVKNKESVDFNPVENTNTDDKNNFQSGISETIVTNKNALHAIVGCFGDSSNGEKLIAELKSKGFNGYKVDVQGGLHRISAGNVKNTTEMNELRQKLSEHGFSSWVLKK